MAERPPDTVIGYVRVSSQDHAESGISLDAQRHRLEAYCAAHGLTLAGVEEDAGISARPTTNRSGAALPPPKAETSAARGAQGAGRCGTRTQVSCGP